MYLGIDPGPEKSSYVVWDGRRIVGKGICDNTSLLFALQRPPLIEGDILIIEEIQSYGMPVGKDIFTTVFWTGRFCEAWPSNWVTVPRIKVKTHFCHTSRAKDGNVRQALIDRFGGKEKAIGKKSNPGILYGIKKDLWSALALVLYYHDLYRDGNDKEKIS